VEIIRIGTRTPVVMPMRITDDLVNMLKKISSLYGLNSSFINHPKEITENLKRSSKKKWQMQEIASGESISTLRGVTLIVLT